MRFMAIVKGNEETEGGELPSEEMLSQMGKFNEELVTAGVLLSGDGLQPSSKGARVRFSGDRRTVLDGPFTETKELVAGYWLLEMASLEEAIEWMKRCPNPTGADGEIEIRQVHEPDELFEGMPPELRESHRKTWEQAAQRST